MHYYCHDCAIANGTLQTGTPTDLTAYPYTLEKYLKHTVAASCLSYNTVFTSAASQTYADYLVTAVASGHVQVDDHGRVNVVWVASHETGIALQGGRFIGPTDAVKVVLRQFHNFIHAMPIMSSELAAAVCTSCGRPVPC